ncbi:MAG TPA: hypothetical protein VIS71_09765, partial [Terrimicrobium sp.]
RSFRTTACHRSSSLAYLFTANLLMLFLLFSEDTIERREKEKLWFLLSNSKGSPTVESQMLVP